MISNECFTKFLKEFTESDPKYYDTVSEISWPRDKDGEKIEDRDPLIPDCQFQMLSLDDIVKGCSKFNENNLPSTTDALWYNLKDDGTLVLYFIEFKWHDLNKMHRDKTRKDVDVIFKLRLKPFESLFLVLPTLFEEYCEKKDSNEFLHLHEFLKTCEIKVYSFVSNFYRIDGGIQGQLDRVEGRRRNRSKNGLNFSRTVGPRGSIGNTIHKQYKRLEFSTIIDFADVFSRSCFDAFLEMEGLLENN